MKLIKKHKRKENKELPTLQRKKLKKFIASKSENDFES